MAVQLNPKHHGGMEWVHIEVLRFKAQLKADPKRSDKAFLEHKEGELERR